MPRRTTFSPVDYYSQMRGAAPATQADPVAAAVADVRATEIEDQHRRDALMFPPPDAAARTNRLSRFTGLPAYQVDGREGELERYQNTDAMASFYRAHPVTAQIMARSPMMNMAAQDDHKALGTLGTAWTSLWTDSAAADTASKVPGALANIPAGIGTIGARLNYAGADIYHAVTYPFNAVVTTGLNAISPGLGGDPDKEWSDSQKYWQAGIDQADKRFQAGHPKYSGAVQAGLLGGLENIGPSLYGLSIGLVSKNPVLAASSMGAITGAYSYADARVAGKDIGSSLRYGLNQGIPEAAYEMFPQADLLKMGGKAVWKPIGEFILHEVPGEMATTLHQSFGEWVELHQNQSFGDWVKTLPADEAQTVLQTLSGGGAQVLATHVVAHSGKAAAALMDKVQGSRAAKREGSFIDRAGQAAVDSKLRARDPESFSDLVRQQGEAHGVNHVFVPASVVKEYMQSDSYDPYSDPFQDYSDQVNEADLHGGDVILPIEFALGKLPGTPAWSAIKDDMRLTPDGLSPREAEHFDGSMQEVMADLSSAAETTDGTARDALAEKVQGKLLDAGFTPYVARQYSELLVQRMETRAGRVGGELSGGEFDKVAVKSILPPALAQARSADTLDLVINAMKKDGKAAGQGQSLLEFIAAKGGIEDKGGNIASIGGDKWHREKPFRKRLLKTYTEAQGSIIGGEYNPNSIESMFDSAVSSGYFPDHLARRENASTYDEALDPNDFINAVSSELRGSPIHAGAVGPDHVRDAAAELQQMLSERGMDPAEMSDAEVRAAVAAMSEEGDGGGYEQLGDTIDIDGTARSTRNSEGQPIAGTEEGVRAFYKWFGDSKVVDADGKPLVVYHGTNQPIETFDNERLGNATGAGHGASSAFFFTSNEAEARDYAEHAGSRVVSNVVEFEKERERLQVETTRLEKIAQRTGNWGPYEQAMQAWEDLEISATREDASAGGNVVAAYIRLETPSERGFGGGDIGSIGEFGSFVDTAREAGADGIIAHKISDSPKGGFTSDHFAVFAPTQIKSINNRGTFDANDPRILNQEARGRIQFLNDQQAVIELFKGRNLSTLLHESSHLWLEELRFDASLPDAPEQIRTDWQTVQDYFASNGHPLDADGNIPTEAHELWARSGERYFMEGKAPVAGLKRLFETFRGWMVALYKHVDALRAPITPEIREVFDRLIATDDQIEQARQAQALAPLFQDAAAIGMTDPEFAAYATQVRQARDEAQGKLLDKTMAAIRRRETARYKEAREGVEAETKTLIDDSPVMRAIKHIKAQAMDAQWVRDEFGADAVDLLPKRTAKEGGTRPSLIAELSGYDTSRQMVEALIGVEKQQREAKAGGDKRSMRARMIETSTDNEMNRRYGDPLNDGTIEREALEAVHNEKQGEVFGAELRALSRKTGQRPTPYRIARDWARNKVAQGIYQVEASPGAIQRHARSVAKSGREAEKALAAGKFDEAFRAKQQQMLSSALLAEAKIAHDAVETARKRMDRVARQQTSKTVDQEYLDQAHALLEAVDLRQRTQKSVNRKASFEAWSAAREAEGYDIAVPPSFEATIGQTNWSKLTTENLLGLDDAVKQIMHLGRMKQTLLDGKERREFDDLVLEAQNGAGNIKGKPPIGLQERGFLDGIKAGASSIDAALLKMETVFDWLDGGNSNGVFNRIVFRQIADAQGREQDMLKDYHGRIKALFEAVPGEVVEQWRDKVEAPFTDPFNGRPFTPQRQRLISMALNIGNEGNMQRLADGYGWNAGAIEGFLTSELTAGEWQFVQGVWDTIETLWPEIEAMEKRVNGITPDKVEVRAVVTPHGTFRGGYYPAIYDSTLNYRAEANKGREADLFEGGYTRATTRSSATKARATKVTAPILLDLGVINRHLGEVIHDVTHREAVMQANKFLTSERVMRLVDEALGPQVRGMFRPWVKFVANSWAMERAGNEGFGKWLGKLRANATAVGMGLRASTMLTQVAGYANSFEVVGEKWVTEAIARTSASPIETFKFASERSPELRHRMETLDRDIRTELARLSTANPASKTIAAAVDAKRFFFHGIGYMDRVVSVPTWLGAYNKALAEGMSEADAAYAGDKAIRVSQGAGAPKDLAAISRGTGKYGEALKLFTMFYSYFSAAYQRQRTLVRDASGADGRRPRNLPKLAARAFWLTIAPPLLTELIKMSMGGGNPPDDDEWWSQWIARKVLSNGLGAIPLARDVFEPAWNAARGAQVYYPEFSPVNRAGTSIVKALGDAGKVARGKETKHATKDVLEATGYVTGLVPGQVASASQFLVDVGQGEARPKDFSDWVQGLSTGKIKD